MLRPHRVLEEPGFYHVYHHALDGSEPFLSRPEAEAFVTRVNDARARDGLAVFAWCLMSTHYHLVLRTREVALCRSLLLI